MPEHWCNYDGKLSLPKTLYDDLARLARANRGAASESIRAPLGWLRYGALNARRGYTFSNTHRIRQDLNALSSSRPTTQSWKPAKPSTGGPSA